MGGTLTNLAARNPAVKQAAYSLSKYQKLGLMYQDLYDPNLPVVKEAITRLSPEVKIQRQYRISRAVYLSSAEKVLPKGEWMTLEKEEDYINDIIHEVNAEKREKADYETKMYSFRHK